MGTAKKELRFLLRPITWDWGSSISQRMNLVNRRHQSVEDAYPFMTKKQQKQADAWFKEESHEGLWD